jgi:hypothetical protein
LRKRYGAMTVSGPWLGGRNRLYTEDVEVARGGASARELDGETGVGEVRQQCLVSGCQMEEQQSSREAGFREI